MLKPGGELCFSDVFADRRIPLQLSDDPKPWPLRGPPTPPPAPPGSAGLGLLSTTTIRILATLIRVDLVYACDPGS